MLSFIGFKQTVDFCSIIVDANDGTKEQEGSFERSSVIIKSSEPSIGRTSTIPPFSFLFLSILAALVACHGSGFKLRRASQRRSLSADEQKRHHCFVKCVVVR